MWLHAFMLYAITSKSHSHTLFDINAINDKTRTQTHSSSDAVIHFQSSIPLHILLVVYTELSIVTLCSEDWHLNKAEYKYNVNGRKQLLLSLSGSKHCN